MFGSYAIITALALPAVVLNVFYSNGLEFYILSGTHENVYLIIARAWKLARFQAIQL